MLLNINEIKINEGRRMATPEAIDAMVASIREVGMMNPITVTVDHVLVAGLHRLEAAKRLGWEEVECKVIEADDLHAELAEIDENVVRTGLSELELCELLARRKKIYELLHPGTIARNVAGHASNYAASNDKLTPEEKPFSHDTAEKMGVSKRTVERQVQIGEKLTPKAKEILHGTDAKITKQNLTKLSRLEPEQQEDAAAQLAEGKIKSVDEYTAGEGSANKKENYYDTPEFIVECFKRQNAELRHVPNNHRERLDNYRKKLSPEHLQALITTSNDTISMLQEYVSFLNNELEVSE